MAQSAFNLLNWLDRSWTTRALEPLLWPALLVLWSRDLAPPAAEMAAWIVAGLFLLIGTSISLASAFIVRTIRRRRDDTRPVLQRIQDHHRDADSLLDEHLALERQPLPAPPAWARSIIFGLGQPLSSTARLAFAILWGLLLAVGIFNAQSATLSSWLSAESSTVGLDSSAFSRWNLALALTALVFLSYLWLWACRTRAEVELRGIA